MRARRVLLAGRIGALDVYRTSDSGHSVRAIMSRGVVVLYPVEPALEAIALMVEHGIRTLPVVTDSVAGKKVAGIVTRRDLARALKP